MQFQKYEAIGNDYLVVESAELDAPLTPARIRLLCDRHLGVGADGVLVSGPYCDGAFSLRIFNPDGSEAEKSGNGLRIYARYLFDGGRVGEESFGVACSGGGVRCRVTGRGALVSVEMGPIRFASPEIPVAGPPREVLRERIDLAGEPLEVSAASMGNPHCVVLVERASPQLARELGPLLEHHPLFPNRTNVQIVQVLGRHDIRIEIWERGAGPTLASGSSACAAVGVCLRLGLCESPVTVRMPAGALQVEIDETMHATQTGPARKVFAGTLAEAPARDAA